MPRGTVRIPLDPPTRGMRADLPKHMIPDGFLTGGKNVLCRDGEILVRPGQIRISATVPSVNSVMGGLFYEDHTQTERLLIGTTSGFHLYTTSWSDITGSALTGGLDNQVRFAAFPFANSTRIIAVNDKDAPQVYTGTGNFAALAGSPPIAKDVTVAFERVVLGNVTIGGTRQSSSLWISGFQDTTAWSALREVNLPDAKDGIVAVRSLNPQVFAVYKDWSQWVGIGTGGLFPFVFELRGNQSGPVSPASVVAAENVHYYIGQDGDVYKFDGDRSIAIGGAIKRLIQSDMYWLNRGRTHGVYDPLNREIWWFWESGLSGAPSVGITYRLPYDDVPGAFSTLHYYGMRLSASFSWRITTVLTWDDLPTPWDKLPYPTCDSMLMRGRPAVLTGGVNGQVYNFGSGRGDDGYSYEAVWDLPWRQIAGPGENTRIDAIESYFKGEAVGLTTEIILVKSDTLSSDEGTTASPQSIFLTSSDKLRATYYDQQARFVCVRHRIPFAMGNHHYRGGVLYVYPRGEG